MTTTTPAQDDGLYIHPGPDYFGLNVDVYGKCDIEEVIQVFTTKLAAAEERGRREVIESLLEWKDQESDIDNRPIGSSYFVLCGSCRESLESILANHKEENG